MTVENEWAWNDTPWQRSHPEVMGELTLVFADGSEYTVTTDGS